MFKLHIVTPVLALSSFFLIGSGHGECLASKKHAEYQRRLEQQPIETIDMLLQTEDCDDKFALLYQADKEIASHAQLLQFDNEQQLENTLRLYQGNLSKYDKFILDNRIRFRSAGEGGPVRPNHHWLDKIENRKHAVIAGHEFEALKSFDAGVWEDGDGSMHSSKIVANYREFMKKYPRSGYEGWILDRIETIQERSEKIRETRGVR